MAINPPSAYVPSGSWKGGSHTVNGVQLVPGAPGYNAQAAAPWHQQIAQTDKQLAAHLGTQSSPSAPTASAGGSLASNPFSYDQKNPYLSQMADTIKGQVNDNLQRNILPNIGAGAQLVGGYGGSRQGVVEANALKDANTTLSNSLTNMYYGDYNNAMNRQLQQYGMDKSYNLGLGNLALGFQNSGNNFALGMGNLALGNRNTDLSSVQLGANLVNQSNQGYLNQGQGIYNLGLTAQQAPWQTVNGMNSATQPYTGFGTTTSNNNGNAGAGFLGGAIAGGQLYNLFNQPSK